MIFDEIFNFMLGEHVGIVNFDKLVVKYCFDEMSCELNGMY